MMTDDLYPVRLTPWGSTPFGPVHRHHGPGHPPRRPQHSHGGADTPPSSPGTRRIKVVRRVLDVNAKVADENRAFFRDKNVFVLNMMSSPGSGKTTTLEKSLVHLASDLKCAVVVGDICTTNDADRLAVSGIPVVQINTDEFGGDCHLAAHVVAKGLEHIDFDNIDLLIVENVGNLVCPAEFDIGEDSRVVILSVTEGEDKPLKYPLMFRECNAAILNKIDLLPYLDYDRQAALDNIRQIHPQMPIFELSSKTEQGLIPWLDWVKAQVKRKRAAHG